MTIPWKATKVRSTSLGMQFLSCRYCVWMSIVGSSPPLPSKVLHCLLQKKKKKRQNQQQTQHCHTPVVATVQCNHAFRLPAHCLEFVAQDAWPYLTLMFWPWTLSENTVSEIMFQIYKDLLERLYVSVLWYHQREGLWSYNLNWMLNKRSV